MINDMINAMNEGKELVFAEDKNTGSVKLCGVRDNSKSYREQLKELGIPKGTAVVAIMGHFYEIHWMQLSKR
jgi:hypothetical protein